MMQGPASNARRAEDVPGSEILASGWKALFCVLSVLGS